MRIRSQSREYLIEATTVRIKKRSRKIVIEAISAGEGMVDMKLSTIEGALQIGEYPDKETAIEEMDRMMMYFVENPFGVYQMN